MAPSALFASSTASQGRQRAISRAGESAGPPQRRRHSHVEYRRRARLKQATTTIPLVPVGDPLGIGILTNLAHPGGNVTGVLLRLCRA
jgi:hypothetical protein